MPRRLVPLALLAFALAGPAPADAARRQRLTVKEQYELGLKYMKRGAYVKALETFNRIRNYHRDDPYAVRAELAIADLHFKKHEWDQARVAYEDFSRRHPRHEQLDYVVYRIGLCWWRTAPAWAPRDQTDTRRAVDAWSGFESRFPDSEYRAEVAELLREARERLARKELLIARFYARRRAWVAVERRARGLLRDYPDSGSVPEALELLAVAALARGEEAGDLLQRLEELDPRRAGAARRRGKRERRRAERRERRR